MSYILNTILANTNKNTANWRFAGLLFVFTEPVKKSV